MTIDELSADTLATQPKSYAEGEAELEHITRAIEKGDIVIDKLSLAVKRADFLNRFLEQFLLSVEQDVKPLSPQAGNEGKPG